MNAIHGTKKYMLQETPTGVECKLYFIKPLQGLYYPVLFPQISSAVYLLLSSSGLVKISYLLTLLPKEIQMNEMRRNEDAIKTKAGTKKILTKLNHTFT